MHLQKRNRQTNDTVTSQSSAEHLVHRPLTQERLDNEYKRTKSGKFLEEAENHLASKNAIYLVDANVDGNMTVNGDEFDYGDFRFRNDRHVVRDPSTLHRVRKGAEDGNFVHVRHTVGLDDQVYVTSALYFE